MPHGETPTTKQGDNPARRFGEKVTLNYRSSVRNGIAPIFSIKVGRKVSRKSNMKPASLAGMTVSPDFTVVEDHELTSEC
jgi:hypothetical protein